MAGEDSHGRAERRPYTRAPMPPSEAVQKALAQLNAGRADQAEALLRRGFQKNPRDGDAAQLLGMVLFQTGRADQAEYFLRGAIKAEPGRAEFHASLGNLLAATNKTEPAVAAFREGLRLDGSHLPSLLGLGLSLMRTGDLTGALDAGRRGLELQPGLFQPWVNVSSILVQSGRVPEAIELLRRARERFPSNVPILTNLLTVLNYAPEETPESRAAAARALTALLPNPDTVAWPNARDPDRRLRIGILSSDLRTHSVAFFIEPVFAHRDRAAFEIVGYSASRGSDETTDRLKALADGWVEVADLGDEALAKRLRADAIDIVVELNGHTTGGRLAALARRGAPIQATYLGYPATTGVTAIDVRLVDAITDPPGTEPLLTERPVRLDGCFVCYRPVPDSPKVAPPPSLASGRVTFGSFNSMPKLNDPLIDTWAAVLRAVPGSGLALKNKALRDGAIRESVARRFAERGIGPDRLELLPPAPSQREHLAAYARVDVALDNFPYNGTTTTCEALWMGVPVVVLEGRGHAARVGASLLTAAGLPEWIARDTDGYVAIATRLAADLPALTATRRALRERVARSPLLDGPGFTKRFESALRSAWRGWCAAP